MTTKIKIPGDQLPEGLLTEDIKRREGGELRGSKNPKKEDLSALLEFLSDKIWWHRHMSDNHVCKPNGIGCAPAKKILKKYGDEALNPGDDFEWGMTNGKLAALRWYIGMGWDMLDS